MNGRKRRFDRIFGHHQVNVGNKKFLILTIYLIMAVSCRLLSLLKSSLNRQGYSGHLFFLARHDETDEIRNPSLGTQLTQQEESTVYSAIQSVGNIIMFIK